MSASDNLNPNQLSMFMQAKTIYAGELNETFGDDRKKKGMMRWKQEENYRGGRDDGGPLNQTLHREGVRTPLEMSPSKPSWTAWNRNGPSKAFEPTLMEGHHRLAWAMGKNPDTELPVTWTDRYSQ